MHTTTKGHIIQLDGIRFIAVALVLVAHLTDTTYPLGELGVTMFFVLSGFLITRILMQSRDKLAGENGGFGKYLRKFLIRRTIRIFPIYYLSILILFIVGEPSVRQFLPWLLVYGTNIYMAIHETWMGSVDHLWSLAVEEQVYIFFPFLIFFVPKKNMVSVLVIMGVLAVLLRLYFFLSGKNWMVSYVSMPACLDSFAFGGLMAWLQLYRNRTFGKLFSKQWSALIGLVAWILIYYWSHYIELNSIPANKYNLVKILLDRFIASAFCFFLIGNAVMGYTGIVASFLESRVSVYLGKISYGIYLYHNFVFNSYHSGPNHPVVRFFNRAYRLFPELRDFPPFHFLAVCLFTVAIAALSWHFIEKPINALKDKYAR